MWKDSVEWEVIKKLGTTFVVTCGYFQFQKVGNLASLAYLTSLYNKFVLEITKQRNKTYENSHISCLLLVDIKSCRIASSVLSFYM